jgi:hypothetical protein
VIIFWILVGEGMNMMCSGARDAWGKVVVGVYFEEGEVDSRYGSEVKELFHSTAP